MSKSWLLSAVIAALAATAVTPLAARTGVSQQVAPASTGSLYDAALRSGVAGRAMTVTGSVDPATLGPTLMHEHLFWDEFDGLPKDGEGAFVSPRVLERMDRRGWKRPATEADRRLFNAPDIQLSHIDDMRQGKRIRANHFMHDEDFVAREIAHFQAHGGKTIVDVTTLGLGPDASRLKRFAGRTGLKIVMGAGWYRWPFHPPNVRTLSVDALAAAMVRQVVNGGADGIRAGIIGEIPLDSRSVRGAATSTRLMPTRLSGMSAAERDALAPEVLFDAEELRVVRAAARASRVSGAALSMHVVDPSLSFLRILSDEGVDLKRVIVGHAHPLLADRAHLDRALDAGVVLQAEYQLQYYATKAPLVDIDPILDGIAHAVRSGRRSQILLSLDLCNRLGYRAYGGGGYATLQNHIFPKLRARGVTQEDLDVIMIDNPRRLLTLAKPQRPLRSD